jgi:hypothetical protein
MFSPGTRIRAARWYDILVPNQTPAAIKAVLDYLNQHEVQICFSDDTNAQVLRLTLRLPDGQFRDLRLFREFLERYEPDEITGYLVKNNYIEIIQKGDSEITDVLRG